MNFFAFFCFVMVLAIAGSSGCAGPVAENQTMPAGTTAPRVSTSSPVITPSSTTIRPQEELVTPGPSKTIKDSELWFTMQVPASWEVTTERISNSEGYEGLVYLTYLYDDPDLSDAHQFYIFTYAITRGQDQAVRTLYRDTWTPLPNESTVTINGITFDRFESRTDSNVKVAYVVRKGSANERGFASVIEYSVNSSGQYRQKDFESFISTFQYKSAKDIKSAAGEEIKDKPE